MKLTVRDISRFSELSRMQLIAGEGGLDREVVHCGILDYEYDREVADKYSDSNYDTEGDFLTLTSFLYAKDDPSLIFDAVKRLISKKGSGLIIKNIYRLPIGENVIRFANSRNFPIFILNESHPYFEDIIIHISRELEKREDIHKAGNATDMLLTLRDANEIKVQELTRDICTYIQNDHFAVYFKSEKSSDISGENFRELYHEAERRITEAGILTPEDAFYLYRNGFMLIHSEARITGKTPKEAASAYIELVRNSFDGELSAGISDIHHRKSQLRDALMESLYAAAFDRAYDELGLYQLIIPHCREKAMEKFSRRMLAPIYESDAEHNTENLLTLSTFVYCGASVERTSEALGQHRNTIRYRLKKIAELSGADPLTQEGCEQLSVALRIRECAERIQDLPEF